LNRTPSPTDFSKKDFEKQTTNGHRRARGRGGNGGADRRTNGGQKFSPPAQKIFGRTLMPKTLFFWLFCGMN